MEINCNKGKVVSGNIPVYNILMFSQSQPSLKATDHISQKNTYTVKQ